MIAGDAGHMYGEGVPIRSDGRDPGVDREGQEVTPHPHDQQNVGPPSALRSPLSPAERETVLRARARPAIFPTLLRGEKVDRDRRTLQPSRAG